MLTLNDGRAELWQWDTGRTLAVDADCSQMHFSNKVFGRSIDVDVVGGVAIIPDVLLQTDNDLNVWAFAGTAENGYTKISKTFKVNRRNKPADYVFTPSDQMTLQSIQRQIGDLSDLTTEAKDTLVAAINEVARTGGGGGGSTVELDTTLSEAGKAADAKAVGDALASKQDTISDLEAIRTGAAKGATALQSVPNTYRTASEQDTIDSGKVDKVTGKGLSSNDYTDAAKAKVDALAPVATSGIYNDLTDKPTIPTKLPNPNALTFTGAVTGSYDGSAPLSVEIPSGGGSGSDISLGLTGATAGQIAKITAVDSDGKPTAWSPVDMPTGGGETWEKIAEIVIPEGADESTALTINKDSDGNPFSLVKARLCAKFPKYTGATTIPNFSFAMLNGKTAGKVTPFAYTSVWPKVSASIITGTVYEIDVSGAQQIEHVIKSGNGGWSDDSGRDYVVYGSPNGFDITWFGDTLWAKPVTSIGGTGMLIYPGCRFVLYGVRV